MHTKSRFHPPAIRQQPALYPERRMTRRKQGGAGGLILNPRNQEPNLGVHGLRISDLMFPVLMLPVRAIRGRLGDRVYKTYGEKIIITRVPRFDGYVPTAAQRERREKMRAATAYAQAVYANPAAKAVYVAAAKQLRRQAFRLAVSDFLHGRPRVMLARARHGRTKHPAASARVPSLPAGPRPSQSRRRNAAAESRAVQSTRARWHRDARDPRSPDRRRRTRSRRKRRRDGTSPVEAAANARWMSRRSVPWSTCTGRATSILPASPQARPCTQIRVDGDCGNITSRAL